MTKYSYTSYGNFSFKMGFIIGFIFGIIFILLIVAILLNNNTICFNK